MDHQKDEKRPYAIKHTVNLKGKKTFKKKTRTAHSTEQTKIMVHKVGMGHGKARKATLSSTGRKKIKTAPGSV